MHSYLQQLPGRKFSEKKKKKIFGFDQLVCLILSSVLPDKYVWICIIALTQQETIDPRRQTAGNQVIDARGRKFTKRVVDIRELNEQAKVIDDLK